MGHLKPRGHSLRKAICHTLGRQFYEPRSIISATEGTFVEIESIHFWLS